MAVFTRYGEDTTPQEQDIPALPPVIWAQLGRAQSSVKLSCRGCFQSQNVPCRGREGFNRRGSRRKASVFITEDVNCLMNSVWLGSSCVPEMCLSLHTVCAVDETSRGTKTHEASLLHVQKPQLPTAALHARAQHLGFAHGLPSHCEDSDWNYCVSQLPFSVLQPLWATGAQTRITQAILVSSGHSDALLNAGEKRKFNTHRVTRWGAWAGAHTL